MQDPRVLVLQVGLPESYLQGIPGYHEPEARLLALARALAANPLWPTVGSTVIVVRLSTPPVLGVVGRFDAVTMARLEGLRWQLANVLPFWRYVTYQETEAACDELAQRLLDRLGRRDLQRLHATALPRGGLVVLGLLAYRLGLRREQLSEAPPDDGPLLVVDDCAISGLRFTQYLARAPGWQVIFAPLFSPPALRRIIEAKEPRVLACLSARDLNDHAPAALGGEYEAWLGRWQERSDPAARWVGLPDQICFPWNEPDVGIWNPVTCQEERGWSLAPPELCLKSRLSGDRRPVEVQVQRPGKGPLAPSGSALFAEVNGEVVVGNLESKVAFALGQTGSDMWRAILAQADLDSAAAQLAPGYDVEAARLRQDLEGFAAELTAAGVLVGG